MSCGTCGGDLLFSSDSCKHCREPQCRECARSETFKGLLAVLIAVVLDMVTTVWEGETYLDVVLCQRCYENVTEEVSDELTECACIMHSPDLCEAHEHECSCTDHGEKCRAEKHIQPMVKSASKGV